MRRCNSPKLDPRRGERGGRWGQFHTSIRWKAPTSGGVSGAPRCLMFEGRDTIPLPGMENKKGVGVIKVWNTRNRDERDQVEDTFRQERKRLCPLPPGNFFGLDKRGCGEVRERCDQNECDQRGTFVSQSNLHIRSSSSSSSSISRFILDSPFDVWHKGRAELRRMHPCILATLLLDMLPMIVFNSSLISKNCQCGARRTKGIFGLRQ